jgi:uncharacterized protein (TIGR04222 family)
VNPLLWRGPEFLGFYLVLVALAIVFLWWRRWHLPSAGPGRGRVTDPLALAWLRGGPDEALRVASFRLLEEGRITLTKEQLRTVAEASLSSHALDAAIMETARTDKPAHGLRQYPLVWTALERIRGSLAAQGYVPTHETQRGFRRLGVLLLVTLLVLAVVKVMVAASHGHTNVLFLILVAIVQAVVLSVVAFGSLDAVTTVAGRQRLAETQAMFSPTREQRRLASATIEERCFMAALFGATVVGHQAGALWRAFTPPPPPSTGGSSSDSSCGSSSGESGGSSGCGGGGCGGCGS